MEGESARGTVAGVSSPPPKIGVYIITGTWVWGGWKAGKGNIVAFAIAGVKTWGWDMTLDTIDWANIGGIAYLCYMPRRRFSSMIIIRDDFRVRLVENVLG